MCRGRYTPSERLTDESTLEVRTLENVADALRTETSAEWVIAFYDRYLNFERVDRAIGGHAGGTLEP